MSRDNAASLAKGMTCLLADSLDFIDDERVQQLLRDAVSNRIEISTSPLPPGRFSRH